MEWPVSNSTIAGISSRHCFWPFNPKIYLPNNFQWVLHNSNRQMRSVVDKPGYIIFGHLRELFLKYAFEAGEDDEALSGRVIVNDTKFDLSFSLF